MRLSFNILLSAAILLSSLIFGSCSKVEEPDYREKVYGYVQFKLYKEASYDGTKAVVSQLDYLKDVTKIKVTLLYDGNEITQTLVMNSSNDEAAEFGLRSDKLKLLAGDYSISTFTLFDKQDQPLYVRTPSEEFSNFTVVAGGLYVHDLVAAAVQRGKVRFSIVKDMSDLSGNPKTKAVTDEYTFDVSNVSTAPRHR